MKKLLVGLLLPIVCCFSLTGCNTQLSASLDKDDVNLKDLPEDYEFTTVVSYDSFSKAVAYDKLNKALSNAKFDIYFIGHGFQSDSIAIASIDSKTGERIGACKTVIKAISPMQSMSGNQMTYIRGKTSYTDVNLKLSIYDPISKQTKNGNISEKYHMDIPTSDEKGVGSFFGDNSAENPNMINPYFFLDTLKANGVIQDQSTVIKKAKAGNITYYKVEYSNSWYDGLGIEECTFILGMNGKNVYGMKVHLKYHLENDSETSMYSNVVMMPFTGKYKDVPTSFSGYEMTIEEYFDELTKKFMDLLK